MERDPPVVIVQRLYIERGSRQPLNSLKKLESLVFVYANGGLADKYESDPVQGENASIEGSWKLPVSKT